MPAKTNLKARLFLFCIILQLSVLLPKAQCQISEYYVKLLRYSEDPGRDLLAIQDDGKIIILFQSEIDPYSDTYQFFLKRLNSDGSFDTGFATNSELRADFGGINSIAMSVSLQDDGKILVVGEGQSATTSEVAVMRFNTDGTIDTRFGTNGIATFDISSGTDRAHDVAVQADGKIVVAGYTESTNKNLLLLRLNSNGTIDNTYGKEGIAIKDFDSGDDEINAIELQPDGKVVAAGYVTESGFERLAIARYNSDGTPDISFGTNGFTTTVSYYDNVDAYNRYYDLELYSDGRIGLAGESGLYNDDYYPSFMNVARYNSNGTLDSSFDGGLHFWDMYSGYDTPLRSRGRSVALLPNQKIIAAGSFPLNNLEAHATIIIQLENGQLEPDFGSSVGGAFGMYDLDIAAQVEVVYSIESTDDLDIIMVTWDIYGINSPYRVGRYFVHKFMLDNVVPVELMDFTVKHNPEGGILLEWQTASELNNDYFEVQHSANGISYTALSKINGVGNSKDMQNYSFSHQDPEDELNYYRLKQVDYDGSYNLSEAVLLEIPRENLLEFDVHPNPLKGSSLNLSVKPLESDNPIILNVIDLKGRNVIQKKIINPDLKNHKISTAPLKSGVYIISITQAGNSVFRKLIIDK